MNKIPSLEELYETLETSEQPTPPDVDSSNDASKQEVIEPVEAQEEKPEVEETGDVVAKAANDVTPASNDEDLPADVKGLQAALKAERVKRQEFGTKVTEYEKQLAEAVKRNEETEALMRRLSHQPQAQPQQTQPQNQSVQQQEIPDPEIDPVGFARWQNEQISAALASRDQALIDTRIVISQESMRQFKPDYDDVEKVFAEEMNRLEEQGDDSLRRKLESHTFPAKYAYEEGKRIQLMREMGDNPETFMQSKIDAAVQEAVAKALAEKQAETPPTQPQVPTVPTTPKAQPPQSLAGVPSTAPRNKPVYSGPVSLEDLYK